MNGLCRALKLNVSFLCLIGLNILGHFIKWNCIKLVVRSGCFSSYTAYFIILWWLEDELGAQCTIQWTFIDIKIQLVNLVLGDLTNTWIWVNSLYPNCVVGISVVLSLRIVLILSQTNGDDKSVGTREITGLNVLVAYGFTSSLMWWQSDKLPLWLMKV